MKRFDYPALKQAAQEDLSRASGDAGRPVLIHTGISVSAILLLAVLDYFLNRQIKYSPKSKPREKKSFSLVHFIQCKKLIPFRPHLRPSIAQRPLNHICTILCAPHCPLHYSLTIFIVCIIFLRISRRK